MAEGPEFALTRAVADYLRLALPEGVLWTHLPFGEARPKATAGRLKAMGVQPGWPDFVIMPSLRVISAVPAGPIFIELKAVEGRLSKAQQIWHDQAKKLGYWVHIARSIEEVEGILRAHGLVPRARVA